MKAIRSLSVISFLVLFVVLFSSTAFAANYTYNVSEGSINISNGTGGKITVSQGENTQNINPADTITITGSTESNNIKVESGVTGVNIILNNVSIDVSAFSDNPNNSLSALDIGDGSSVILTLTAGTTNTFISGYTKAGIKVEEPESGSDAASVTISGSGKLIAVGGAGHQSSSGGSGAGIGSNGIRSATSYTIPSAGNITIEGGTIIATGGEGYPVYGNCGAGIGGGGGSSGGSRGCNAGTTTIKSGTITATGGSGRYAGPGIGGGSADVSGTMGTVRIEGGTVIARSGDGTSIASGIGYGYARQSNNVRTDLASITITGDAVVDVSTSDGERVYAAIGHNNNGTIEISGTATVIATKGTSVYTTDCGTIACNNLDILGSPSITVYSPDRQGDECSIGNTAYPKDNVKPIYANSITTSVSIISGIFASPPKTKTIILTGGEPSSTKTIILPENCSSFATTVDSAGTYTGMMGIDVFYNQTASSEEFNLSNTVNTFNVKQLDITPPGAPGILSAAAGPYINAQEEASGVEVEVSLGTSGALEKDTVELLLAGESFSPPVKYVLTAADISADECTITIPASRLGSDGSKSITARITDEAGNVGPVGEDVLILYLDKSIPAAPTEVMVYPSGGLILSNTLNGTNTNLTAEASIVADEATDGCARLYINGVLIATDDTILAEDTQVTFDLGQSTAEGLQAMVAAGGEVSVELIDLAGNSSVSLINNPILTVDYTAPIIESVEVPVPASYNAGKNLDFIINYSEPVLVSEGTPYIQLLIETGGTVSVEYIGGSGTSELIFRYTVTKDDNDTDGVQITSESVHLSGAVIRDAAGNDAGLTLLNVGDTGEILVDNIDPQVLSVGLPIAKTYTLNQGLDFAVNFSENVIVDTAGGTPALLVTLSTGGTVNVNYLSGSGNSTLIFRYTIQSGNLDSDGIVLGSSIVLNGSTIKDIAGNDTRLELSGLGDTSEIKVDGIAPVIISATIAPNNTYIDITFSEGIYGAGALTPDKLSLTFAPNSGYATNAAISSIKKNDSEDEGLASALLGGETTVRVFINVTGIPSGFETIVIGPADGSSVYDGFGNAMAEEETTGVIFLTDRIAPVVDSSAIITASNATTSSVQLAWPAATDEKTAASNLQYKVVYSLSDDITTVADAQSNGRVALNWMRNLTVAAVTGLRSGTTYYFNVLVRDEAGNITAYTTTTMTTLKAAPAGSSSPPPSQVITDDYAQNAGRVQQWTNTQGQSVTTVTADPGKMSEILGEKGSNAVITISVTAGTEIAEGVFTGDIVRAMNENGATLVMQTERAAYSLPASDIDTNAISKQFGENVTPADIQLTARIAEPSENTAAIVRNAANEGGFALVVPAVEFTVSCSYKGRTVEVKSFNSYVERIIAIPDGVDPAKITTAIVVEPDGSLRHVPTTIIEKDGKYYARINSLTNSTYALIYNPVRFTDVESHWAGDVINDIGSRMIINGVGDGLFMPDKNMTRAEFAAIVVKALGLVPGTTESSFNDVQLSDWFNGYVDTATSYGLITGYNSKSFGPGDHITREQVFTMIARAMKLTGINVSLTYDEVSIILSAYNDGTGISGYARESTAVCLKTGITTRTTESTILPKEKVTRAEVAVMIQRLLKISGLI